MTTKILMPALSPTMEEGTLAKWLVKEGDTVSAGDILAEIETDKATMEFEAVDEGIISKILVSEGSEGIKVNSPIAILEDGGEHISDLEVSEIPNGNQTLADTKNLKPKIETSKIESISEPEWTDATKVSQKTVREALRDAMAEEMRLDEKFFLWEKRLLNTKGHIKSAKVYLKNSAQKESLTRQLLNMALLA